MILFFFVNRTLETVLLLQKQYVMHVDWKPPQWFIEMTPMCIRVSGVYESAL